MKFCVAWVWRSNGVRKHDVFDSRGEALDFLDMLWHTADVLQLTDPFVVEPAISECGS